MEINDFHHPTKGLGTFDLYLATFNKISKGSPMPNMLAVMYLKSASHGNKELLSAWTQYETMTETMKLGTIPTYDEYYEYMLGYATKLEAAVANNTSSQKAKSAESDYSLPYSLSDACYNNATELSTYIIDQGEVVDIIQDVLQCNQARKQGKPCSPPQIHQ